MYIFELGNHNFMSDNVQDNEHTDRIVPVWHYREDGFIPRTRVKGSGNQLSTGLHWHSPERGHQAWI